MPGVSWSFTVRASPAWLLKLAGLAVTCLRPTDQVAACSFTLVFPNDPVMATTSGASCRSSSRPAARTRAAAASIGLAATRPSSTQREGDASATAVSMPMPNAQPIADDDPRAPRPTAGRAGRLVRSTAAAARPQQGQPGRPRSHTSCADQADHGHQADAGRGTPAAPAFRNRSTANHRWRDGEHRAGHVVLALREAPPPQHHHARAELDGDPQPDHQAASAAGSSIAARSAAGSCRRGVSCPTPGSTSRCASHQPMRPRWPSSRSPRCRARPTPCRRGTGCGRAAR